VRASTRWSPIPSIAAAASRARCSTRPRRPRRARLRVDALEVRVDNVAAIRLYERRGYEVVGVTDDFYEDGSDALRMRKRLRGDAARC
jgi:ribosomal protein S18 acetylase RimI-like enzyme